ncbi:MAG: PAS domain-containing protein, partial [Gelidibacter sp.]|nr:PAS domain-containing protein [Gelidibacter sp.]
MANIKIVIQGEENEKLATELIIANLALVLQEELIEAKEKAERNENYYNTIINKIGEPIFVKDDQSRLVLVNNAFCKLFDISRSKIIGKTLAEDVSPDERDSFLKIDREVFTDGLENINEESITVRGGETRMFLTNKNRFFDKNGTKYLIGISHD